MPVSVTLLPDPAFWGDVYRGQWLPGGLLFFCAAAPPRREAVLCSVVALLYIFTVDMCNCTVDMVLKIRYQGIGLFEYVILK